MTNNHKINLLQTLINESKNIRDKASGDPDFKVWKSKVERNLVEIFGLDSIELRDFKKLNFFYKPMYQTPSNDFTEEHKRIFTRDLNLLVKSLDSYIQETPNDNGVQIDQKNFTTKKIFISHASSDSAIVEEIIDLLENIGLSNKQIFCSSLEGYGISLGDNFLETIKNEINDSVLVLFILSNSFYSSPICLCEMGATWVMSTNHIPILIPPFEFTDIKGVIPLTQGLKVNDARKWNSLKQKIEAEFKLASWDLSKWERKRDKAITIISGIIKNRV